MKTFVVLAVGIVLASILFCPMPKAAPSMPKDVEMVKPDPSLPKELADFWGKWEGADRLGQYFLIVEKIDEEKASLYWWRSRGVKSYNIPAGWQRVESNVIKEGKKYKLWYGGGSANYELTLKGEYLDMYGHAVTLRLRRFP